MMRVAEAVGEYTLKRVFKAFCEARLVVVVRNFWAGWPEVAAFFWVGGCFQFVEVGVCLCETGGCGAGLLLEKGGRQGGVAAGL